MLALLDFCKIPAMIGARQFLRGKYDIAVVAEVASFEDAAAVKVLVAASGALNDLEMLEYIDMNDIAGRANKMTGAYRAPGG